MGHLKLEGIQSSIHYPPFYSFSAYSNLIRRGDLPIADEICERINITPSSTFGRGASKYSGEICKGLL